MEPFLYIDEASGQLRIPVETLRTWRKAGKGPRSAKIGKRIVYRQGDLDAWIDEQFAESGSANGAA